MISKAQSIRIKQPAYDYVLAVNKLRSASSIEKVQVLKQKSHTAKDAFDKYLEEITVE